MVLAACGSEGLAIGYYLVEVFGVGSEAGDFGVDWGGGIDLAAVGGGGSVLDLDVGGVVVGPPAEVDGGGGDVLDEDFAGEGRFYLRNLAVERE